MWSLENLEFEPIGLSVYGSSLASQTYNLSKTSVTDWLSDWLSDLPNSREASASKKLMEIFIKGPDPATHPINEKKRMSWECHNQNSSWGGQIKMFS